MRNKLLSACLFLLFFLCLIYREPVITGCAQGLVLWYRHVLPSLLPFMILVQLMLQTGAVSAFGRITGPLMRYFPGVSHNASFAVTAGFLCGYPMGARLAADLTQKKLISPEEGAYLLSFCNNMSPMFIWGVLFRHYIPEKALHLPLFLILAGTPLLCSRLFRPFHLTGPKPMEMRFPSPTTEGHRFSQALDESLTSSADAILRVALYMMLASILVAVLDVLLTVQVTGKSLFLASFEITTGLSMLEKLPLSRHLRYVLLLALTSFGGWSSVLQTMSMIRGSGLKLAPYIAEKLITAGVTSLLAFLYLCI